MVYLAGNPYIRKTTEGIFDAAGFFQIKTDISAKFELTTHYHTKTAKYFFTISGFIS
jgi:hypothetical protein